MDGISSGTAAQVKEMFSVGHIDARHNLGGQTHGEVKHAHEKTFAPLLLAVSRPVSLGPARSHGLVQLRPGFQQMVMVHDDVTQIFGGVRIGIGFVLFYQKLHGHQCIQQSYDAPNSSFSLPGNLLSGKLVVADNGKHVHFNGGMKHTGLPEKT